MGNLRRFAVAISLCVSAPAASQPAEFVADMKAMCSRALPNDPKAAEACIERQILEWRANPPVPLPTGPLEMQCQMAGSERLPKLADAKLIGVKMKEIHRSQSAITLLRAYGGSFRTAEDVDGLIRFMSPALEKKARSELARGQLHQMLLVLADALAPKIQAAAIAEFEMSSGPLTATYGFICAWGSEGRLAAANLGLIR